MHDETHRPKYDALVATVRRQNLVSATRKGDDSEGKPMPKKASRGMRGLTEMAI